ncbi:MAG: hypothetical protein KKA42_04520 [candidate division Zixibacteria bacterium]|nr:hypothetical protein [candidate division Zixibacteria bacterium]
MSRRLLAIVLGLAIIMVGSAHAQFEQDPDDAGVADTVDMVISTVPDATTNQLHVQMDFYVLNDSNDVVSATCGFGWDNPNLQMDSAKATAEAIAAFNLQIFLLKGNSLATTNADQEFLFGGTRISGSGMVAGPTRRLWASYYFTLSDWDVTDSIVVDTSEYNAGAKLKFIELFNASYVPYYTGPDVVYDSAYTPPSDLIVSDDTLFFTSVQGDPDPPSQTFDLLSSNAPLSFSVIENVSWIVKSPVSGVTPATVTVSMNTLGLAAGTYFDSIRVEASGASNSPRFVYVSLELAEPAPTIAVSPPAFFFNAIAGGSNPSPQVLSISNTGGVALNWTVLNSQSWLSLSPTSGVDDGTVTLTVDITGLVYDDYIDTIVVTDPTADNDPVYVPVYLSVGSDLPIIVVDSAINYFVVSPAELPIFERSIYVRNGGAGTMNFWVEENSIPIIGLIPSASVADDSVSVRFKTTSVGDGGRLVDTVWVYSNEAINSPQRVILDIRVLSNPAEIRVTEDTVHLELYECGQGSGVILPQQLFSVLNVGGDNPMWVDFFWESDIVNVQGTAGEAPRSFMVSALEAGLPAGVYYDTIMFTSRWAVNSPQLVIVEYSVIEGTEAPVVLPSRTSITIPYQEDTGPKSHQGMQIDNQYGGCMAWQIVEDVDWLAPFDTVGNVPAEVPFLLNPAGYTFGEYPDSLFILAPEASNSPVKISLSLRVWRFHGDVNYDAIIDIADLTDLIRFLFLEGPIPRPTYLVGDCDCNNVVDIGDLTYMIIYMFQQGPIPCGNPYKK